MTMTRRLAALMLAAVLGVLLLGACQSNSSSGAGSDASAAAVKAHAHASAIAADPAAQAGKADAETLAKRCVPQSAAGQLRLLTSKAARQDVYSCAGVPKGQREAAAACTLNRMEHGAKPPKGSQAREEWVLAAVTPCIAQYQGGGK